MLRNEASLKMPKTAVHQIATWDLRLLKPVHIESIRVKMPLKASFTALSMANLPLGWIFHFFKSYYSFNQTGVSFVGDSTFRCKLENIKCIARELSPDDSSSSPAMSLKTWSTAYRCIPRGTICIWTDSCLIPNNMAVCVKRRKMEMFLNAEDVSVKPPAVPERLKH